MAIQHNYEEFYKDFLIESHELLQAYEENLLNVEAAIGYGQKSTHNIAESFQSIFRNVHTLKSLAGMMDFHSIKNYAHEAENILDIIRNEQIILDTSVINICFSILDTLKILIQNIADPHHNVDAETAYLKQFLSERVKNSETFTPSVPDKATEAMGELQSISDRSLSSATIRVDTKRLDDLITTVGELIINKNQLLEITQTINTIHHNPTEQFPDQKKIHSELDITVNRISRLMLNLQEASMKLRMVPVGYTLRKFHRLIRDLAKENYKQVHLEISGEDTEIDRSVIELVEDPLLHILRNAIDHGIEPPEIREAKGKSTVGKIMLSAYQEDNMIVMEISDDGIGIDSQAVYWKAIEKGFIEPTQAFSEKEMLNLIFLPGFSTAKKVTDLSGRGVGMDVVKKNIVKLNGLIDINSEVDQGTTITLRLPLTLAVIQVLLVKMGTQCYGLPLTNVIETLRISPEDIEWVHGREAITLRDRVLPVIRLNEILCVETCSRSDKVFIVVVGIAENRIGLVVDGLLKQQDVVIKPLGNYLERIPGISGATILGNGDISLIIDVATVLELSILKPH